MKKGDCFINPQSTTIEQLMDLAIKEHRNGNYSQAEQIYQKILLTSPDHPDALHLSGMLFHQVGDTEAAIELITKALDLNPDNAIAHCNYGVIMREVGNPDEAAKSYQNALAIRPDYAEARNNLGNVMKDLGRFDEAAQNCRKAIAIKPNYAEAHNNLGNILEKLGQIDEAEVCYRKAIVCNSNLIEAHLSLGCVLKLQENPDKAIASFYKALELNPDYALAHNNLGNAFQISGNLEEAVASYERALFIKTDFAEAHKNLGLTLLSLGRIRDGLDKLEWRWRDPIHSADSRDFSQPMWDGISNLKNKTILIWPEQGPQDIIIWASVIPQLVERAGNCVVEVEQKLLPLFTRTFPTAIVRDRDTSLKQGLSDFDCHLPMGSLFRCLEEHIGDSPNAYLIPAPERVLFWKKRLAKLGPKPHVGVSWKSPVITPERSPNYTMIDDWAPIFTNRKLSLINLQCGNYQQDLADANKNFNRIIHDFDDLDLYNDLDDVAALSQALDLTISVSTAVAAISAGVGTPTWLVSWNQSPWNNILHAPRGPSVTSFSRNTGESWDNAFALMAGRLESIIIEYSKL